jgi:hypothetical protein
MALQHSFRISGVKLISGDGFIYDAGQETITTASLYVKVTSISGNKNQLTASVSFLDQENAASIGAKDYLFTLDLDGPNPIKQAYEHLKTLPEFQGAEDC